MAKITPYKLAAKDKLTINQSKRLLSKMTASYLLSVSKKNKLKSAKVQSKAIIKAGNETRALRAKLDLVFANMERERGLF